MRAQTDSCRSSDSPFTLTCSVKCGSLQTRAKHGDLRFTVHVLAHSGAWNVPYQYWQFPATIQGRFKAPETRRCSFRCRLPMRKLNGPKTRRCSFHCCTRAPTGSSEALPRCRGATWFEPSPAPRTCLPRTSSTCA